jgi:hypothetical protein
VEHADPIVAERPEYGHTAQPEHDLLPQAVARVAAVQVIGEAAVVRAVRLPIGIQEEYRDDVAGNPADPVPPGSYDDRSAFHQDRDPDGERLQELLGAPGRWLLGLVPLRAEALAEIPLALQERDAGDGNAQVGTGTEGVAGEHAQAAAVGRHGGLEADLHRKVGYDRGVRFDGHRTRLRIPSKGENGW